ncbi:MAG: N-acetylglucosamine-6-phosphate deacetylase [Verrucomicrobiota bacterium]
MVFGNARVIFGDGISEDVEVRVEGGVVAEVGQGMASRDVIDLHGAYLAPGFVDLHVHGAMGRDTMEAKADALRALCDFHLRGGTTALLPTTVTAPLEEICAVVTTAEEASAELPQIIGVHIEGPFIAREKAGAQNSRFICAPTGAAVSRLLELAKRSGARGRVRRITLAPELPGAVEAVARFVNAGFTVSGGHSNAWEEEAKACFERGMHSVTHTFNCMSSARQRGKERVAGLLEFALSESQVRCELIADGYHVSTTLMRMLYAAKGAKGIILVTDATAGAGSKEGTPFQLGGRECVVENGACWLADRSALAGSAASMIELVRTMVNRVDVPLAEAVAMASRNPACAIGLHEKGEIARGRDADLLVLSPELEVQQVYLRGERAL